MALLLAQPLASKLTEQRKKELLFESDLGADVFFVVPPARVDNADTQQTHAPDRHLQPGLTDGAVLSVPALVTLAFAVLAGPVFDAERVAHALVAGCTRPAFLAATGSAHAHPVGSAVDRANLCEQQDKLGSQTFWNVKNTCVFSLLVLFLSAKNSGKYYTCFVY